MKEDASNGDEATSLSKIFKELAKLERDFRYQETLYKIKTDELEKATSSNKILKEHLETAYSEIESLRNNVQSLEMRMNQLEVGSNHEKEFCDQVVQKLTEKVTAMTAEHKVALEKQEAFWKKTKSDLQVHHNSYLSELQRKHSEALMEIEQELQREINHAKQLQSKLDFTMEDNLLLQDKVRKLHQEYLPLEAYKTQLKSLHLVNEKLKTQCLQFKTDYQSLANENAHLQKHNERLNQFVNTYNDQQADREKEKEAHESLVSKFQMQLNEMMDKCDLLKVECKHLQEENANLFDKLELYKGEYCNVSMHRSISEQNQILQELVKEMRKERMRCNGDQLQTNLDETEERIKRLEELIRELKQVLVGSR